MKSILLESVTLCWNPGTALTTLSKLLNSSLASVSPAVKQNVSHRVVPKGSYLQSTYSSA